MSETEPSLHRFTAARLSTLCFVAVAIIAFPLMLHWGRNGWFTQDDWDFLSARTAFSPDDLFRAHFQHWTTLPILAYRVMWQFVGLHNYSAYQAMSIALHLVAAALLLAVMRRAGVRPWLATLVAIVFVFFGAGAENILIAFQITFVGSLVFGLAHLLLADHDGPIDRRDWLGLLAGFAGLLCSGVAITMVFVVGVAVMLRRGRRGWRVALFHTVPLGALYLVWLVLAPEGQETANYHSQSVSQVFRFVTIGFEAAFARLGHMTGLGFLLGFVLIAGVVALFLERPRRFSSLGKLAPPFALLAGALAFLIVTGIVRSGQGGLLFLAKSTGPERARESRYVYLIAAMSLPALALGADVLIRRWKLVAIPVVAVLLVGVPGNINALMHPDSYFEQARFYKNTILEVPKLPLVDQLDGSNRLLPIQRLAAEGLTYDWLIDNRANGKIPPPPRLHSVQVNTQMLHFYIVPAPVTSAVTCKAIPLGAIRVLEKGDKITIQGGFVYIRYVPEENKKSFRVKVRPSTLKAMAGPMRLQIVAGKKNSMLCE